MNVAFSHQDRAPEAEGVASLSQETEVVSQLNPARSFLQNARRFFSSEEYAIFSAQLAAFQVWAKILPFETSQAKKRKLARCLPS